MANGDKHYRLHERRWTIPRIAARVVAIAAGVTVVLGAVNHVWGLIPHHDDSAAIAAYQQQARSVCKNVQSIPSQLPAIDANGTFSTAAVVQESRNVLTEADQLIADFNARKPPSKLRDQQQREQQLWAKVVRTSRRDLTLIVQQYPARITLDQMTASFGTPAEQAAIRRLRANLNDAMAELAGRPCLLSQAGSGG